MQKPHGQDLRDGTTPYYAATRELSRGAWAGSQSRPSGAPDTMVQNLLSLIFGVTGWLRQENFAAVFDVLMFPSLETRNRTPRTMILATSRHLLRRLSPAVCPRTARHDGKRFVSAQSVFTATDGVWICEKTEYSRYMSKSNHRRGGACERVPFETVLAVAG
jgi:hypothetical protein